MNRKVFTYKDIEEAWKYIGKFGIFSDSLEDIDKSEGDSGILLMVENDDYHFKNGYGARFQFFSPDPEPIETWVPFTAEDCEVFMGKTVRVKGMGGSHRALITSCLDVGVTQGHSAVVVRFETLFERYTFADGTPCGKKVTQ